MEDCRLSDLGFSGPRFTWTNGQRGDGLTLERLDRAFANSDWCWMFNVVEVDVLPRCFSYHNPLLISFSHNQATRWQKSKSFHFEASWTKHPDHKVLVKKVWRVKDSSGDKWGVIHRKLQACQKTLQHWVRKSCNQGEAKIQEKLGKLQAFQQLANPRLVEEEVPIKEELNVLLDQEDLKWR